MKIFVGGLSPDVTDDNLKDLFTPHGQVDSAQVVRDRYTDQPRGFGFVEMPGRSEAVAAISALNGSEYLGRTLEVNEARPPVKRSFDGPPRGGRDRDRNRNKGRGGRPGGGRRF